MRRMDRPRVAIIGAGPIGLEAGLAARTLDWPTTIYEAGEIAQHLQHWGHVKLFTPFSWNRSALGMRLLDTLGLARELPDANAHITGHDYRTRYLLPIAQSDRLANCIRTGTRILHVARKGWLKDDARDPKRAFAPFRLLVQQPDQTQCIEEADVVLDCSGVYSHANWLGDGGIPAIGETAVRPQIVYGLEDILGASRKRFAGKSILVVGSGYSAAHSVCSLARVAEDNPATWIIWLARNGRSQPLPRIPQDPLKERDRLAAQANGWATRGNGNVEYHNQTGIESILSHGPDKGFRVETNCDGETSIWEVEQIIANIGYRGDDGISRELHVGPPAPPSPMTDEPGFFRLGIKSYGRDSRFLLKQGYDQIKAVFAQIAGRPVLEMNSVKG
ncbi:NAD(P)/FAD-dependent oxidoreductase [Tuwongella immobilis]|uniref:FAD/NAD(P)-binding domain-containing protein n=1 Tax=Tuwongella immobilis TaxID=692036 RepID=A0A6C2YJG7_9BACT|nr:monooxygenase [Tuwongella immobilis]VIP01112.1 Putative secreted protein OS=Blastopirellula marina DSM 3645 GN=DSM3645_22244 PE=4 SV=1: Pyr_redox_3 [Tuwongella immobilis]VTR97649.1 Putative secreted protein OS=Blastopirellula marina DSM 3645 GN=DSM3645_22244 PE=4 SV=1: Pyr_redox_3 [Tuwongella immobilis]